MGSEIRVVLLQTGLCGLLGAGFGACSVIWQLEHWSLVKQTGIYFLAVSLLMLPIAYLTYWMEHTLLGFLSYFGLFALIFLLVWAVQFWAGRRRVRKMNEQLHRMQGEASSARRG